MSDQKESFAVNSETFKVIGSQINLTPRSDKISLEMHEKNWRPFSAVHSCTNAAKQKAKLTRPKSAESNNLIPSECKFLQLPMSSNENKLSGEFSIAVSNFTNLSTKLLKNLLESSKQKELLESRKDCVNSSFQLSSDYQSKNEMLCTNCLSTDLKFQKNSYEKNTTPLDPIFYSKLDNHPPHFCGLCQKKCVYRRNRKKCFLCLENECKQNCQKILFCQRKDQIDKYNTLELEVQKEDMPCKSESDSSSLSLGNEAKIFEISQFDSTELNQIEDGSSVKNTDEKFAQKKKISTEELQSLRLLKENLPIENEVVKKSESLALGSNQEISLKHTEVDEENANINYAHQNSDITDPTYEEMVLLLRTLDEEDSESLTSETVKDAAKTLLTVKISPEENADYNFAISSYLQELEAEDSSLHENYVNMEKWNSVNITSPRLEELLKKNSVELAHEVFSLKIQIEDQKRGITLLKDALSKMKEQEKTNELEHQEALNKVTSETETLVQRHQKFIKQLLNEKKNLNETVLKLVQDLKSEEERYKRNIKAIEEKHLAEIKRAKEAQAAADKIKREKWMESKTQKIKDMTVKSLEPELSRMASRQQEEMTELRNLHKAELEAIELRAARRNSELMDELRAELTKEKECAIAKKTAALRSELEKEFQNEKNRLQNCIQTLKECIRKEEERSSKQELEFQQRLIDFKQEEEKKRQEIISDHRENLEELRRQHLIELKNLKESEKADKEVSLNNLKKQQAAEFLEREAKLHQQFKTERDKEIELVIETLEKESAQIQSELNAANEGKLKRLREKMEAEMKEIEESESALKLKLSEIKSKLSEKEDCITELNLQIKHLQTELLVFKKTCEEMSLEKTKLKEIIRKDFESSMSDLVKKKESLEKEIVTLKELHLKELSKKDQLNIQAKYEMQKELTRVYSRIKAAVNKKEKIIESLREENEAAYHKCRQLEFLLDQQRRNLLL